MKNKILKLLILLILIICTIGCTSQTENPTNSEKTNLQTITVRDLHNVKFHLVDQNNTPIYGVYVTANYNSTEYPNTLNTPIDNRAYTDEYGNLSFVMRGSIKYEISASNLRDGYTRTVMINPTGIEYLWPITPIPTSSPVPTRTNEWTNYQNNNWIFQTAKGICSFIPSVNTALNC
jgi:hypothetical protein